MSEVSRSNWLWRSAVAAPLVKGVLCGVLGVTALAYSLSNDGHEALMGTLLFSSSFALIAASAGYVAAAFLVAGRGPGWLGAGALLDGMLTLLIVLALIWVGLIFGLEIADGYEAALGPLAIAIIILVIWIVALIPIVAVSVGKKRSRG
jgi:hypothetical protein